jgi:hypothetical protein
MRERNDPEAGRFLEDAVRRFPASPEFPLLLAYAYFEVGCGRPADPGSGGIHVHQRGRPRGGSSLREPCRGPGRQGISPNGRAERVARPHRGVRRRISGSRSRGSVRRSNAVRPTTRITFSSRGSSGPEDGMRRLWRRSTLRSIRPRRPTSWSGFVVKSRPVGATTQRGGQMRDLDGDLCRATRSSWTKCPTRMRRNWTRSFLG